MKLLFLQVYLMYGDEETVTAPNVKYPALNAFSTSLQVFVNSKSIGIFHLAIHYIYLPVSVIFYVLTI